jgi:glycosyltransferase involved in cell wall biosynthesis
MNVLMFVANRFNPDRRVYAEAKALIKAGHQVIVIAFDRLKQKLPKENCDGVQVFRLRTRLSPAYGFGSLLWNGINMLLWQWKAYRVALKLHKEYRFCVIHCHDFDTLPIGVGVKLKLGLPLIYDAHEMYGYTMARVFPRFIVNVFLWLERRLVRMADRIIVVVEYQKQYFEKITGKPIYIIMNCRHLQNVEYQDSDREEKFTVFYAGAIAKRRFVLELCNVVSELPDINCLLAGDGEPQYVQYVKDKVSLIPNITFLGWIPFDDVISITKRANVCICMIDPMDLNNRIGLANKLFDAMVCGRPAICTKGTYSGELTEKEKVGLAVEYTENALKQAIIKLRDDAKLRERLGRNALRAAVTKYNWQNQERTLLELYGHIESELGEQGII